MSYGNGLDIEWTDWQIAKIAEIKARRNVKPLRYGDVYCAWTDCPRKAVGVGKVDLCWKHYKLRKALGGFFRDY